MLNRKNKVVAVMVTYNPDPNLLLCAVDSLSDQVSSLVIVDNGSDQDLQPLLPPHSYLILIKNGRNLGVATGQNIGIREALNQDADFILLSDQDSVYPVQYVKKLLDSFLKLGDKRICAIGPKFLDLYKDRADPIILPSKSFKKSFQAEGIHEVKQMIASGMLMRSDVLRAVGLMRDDLFVDWVDLEWCWRARAKGYKLYIDAGVSMRHRLGEGLVKLAFGKVINHRSPSRHYYITRNALYLALHADSIGKIEKLMLFFSVMKYLVIFPIFLKPRYHNAKAVVWAFYDALKSYLGPCRRALI